MTIPAANREYFQLQHRLREGRMHRVRITYRRIWNGARAIDMACERFFNRHPLLKLSAAVLLVCGFWALAVGFLVGLDSSWSR
jgi:hypothetical protein